MHQCLFDEEHTKDPEGYTWTDKGIGGRGFDWIFRDADAMDKLRKVSVLAHGEVAQDPKKEL